MPTAAYGPLLFVVLATGVIITEYQSPSASDDPDRRTLNPWWMPYQSLLSKMSDEGFTYCCQPGKTDEVDFFLVLHSENLGCFYGY